MNQLLVINFRSRVVRRHLLHVHVAWHIFVTTGAIDLKLCTYVPVGQMTSQNKFRFDPSLGLVTRVPKPKTWYR
jgi:hypothetical protein